MLYTLIGQNIRNRRLRRGWTQEQLAEQANISLSFLGHIERGTRKLSVDTLYNIAEALGCSADELMGILVRSDRKEQSAQEILQHIMNILEKEK